MNIDLIIDFIFEVVTRSFYFIAKQNLILFNKAMQGIFLDIFS